jgi:uncharacterized protein YndB with AHSA1/START domain
MRFVRSSIRPAYALFVIAHGLAHAVLPMRGFLDPVSLQRDLMPAILYGVAFAGFVVAGMGILSIRPFTALTRPVLVVAAGWSLVAIYRLGDAGLWPGAAIDLALLISGFTGAYQGMPEPHANERGLKHATAFAMAVGFVGYATFAGAFWSAHRTWGSTVAEHQMALPGDRADRNPALELQHAVTIDAPPEAVWPWLVQLGQDRAGFYSYDWLERAFGVDVHNVKEIRPEWQHREAGELLRATQPTYLGGLLGPNVGWNLTQVDPGRALVLQNWGAFVLVPTGDGKTRFIIRSTIGNKETPAWAAALDVMTFELPHFIMERRMMLTIKELAEKHAGTHRLAWRAE